MRVDVALLYVTPFRLNARSFYYGDWLLADCSRRSFISRLGIPVKSRMAGKTRRVRWVVFVCCAIGARAEFRASVSNALMKSDCFRN